MSGERSILLVPDLALERWPSMDRYANALTRRLPELRVPTEALTMAGPRYLARYMRYPRALRRYHPSLVHVVDHSYAHCLRAFKGVPSVVTIHDLFPMQVLLQRERTPRALVRDAMLRRMLAWVTRADVVISATRFVAKETTRVLGIGANRIRFASYGVDEAFFERPAEAVIEARRADWRGRTAGRPDGRTAFVLHVGSCLPRKNVEGVIAAVGELRRRGTDAALVQIGGRFTPDQRGALARAGLASATIQEPQATDASLMAAYHAADLMLFPSHYEGFGLPALEALAAGLPVVTSGAGGLAEAVGDAAVIVQPPEPGPLADAMEQVLAARGRHNALDALDAQAARGREWARRFTWDASAAAHRLVYDELLGSP